VTEIRASNLKATELAKKYLVSSSCISNILKNKTWRKII
jgi:Mor family transcriptional regulator